MRSFQLQLLTANRDEIGRLALPAVQIQDDTSTNRLDGPSAVIGQVEELYSRIEAAIKAEQFGIVGNVIDFRLTVSRALLSDNGETTVIVPLVVEPLDLTSVPGSPSTDTPIPSPGLLDELFDLPINSGGDMEGVI